MAKREWRSFEDARKYTRSLGLTGKNEWQEYSKSGKSPDDIPSSPDRVYKSQWQNWGDWLGTEWRPFEEAREFVRGLGLKNRSDWQEYCRSGEKPADIPADPCKIYKAEFKGWGDWLGTGNVHSPEYRSFFGAREYARSLGLKDVNEWREYCKSGKKPDDIPASPYGVYRSQWTNWRDWLGTVNVPAVPASGDLLGKHVSCTRFGAEKSGRLEGIL